MVSAQPNSTVDRCTTVALRKVRIASERSRVRKPMPIDMTTNIAPISVAAAAPISAKKSCQAGSSDANDTGTARAPRAQPARNSAVAARSTPPSAPSATR